MSKQGENADVTVRAVLRVAKDLHAAQQQSRRLLATYKDVLGKLPGELWTDSGILHVVDANRTVWCLAWNGGYPTVARVPAVDVTEAVEEPNEKLTLPKVVYTENGTGIMLPAMWGEATEGRPVETDGDEDEPTRWHPALDI